MEDEIEDFIADAAEADTEAELKRLFLRRVEALGYHGYDAYRHRVTAEVDILDRANFVVCSYDFGMLSDYLDQGMAEICPALQRVSEAMTPFDYIAFLKSTPENAAIVWQRRMIKLAGVGFAWCVPLSAVQILRGVTVYMRGHGADEARRFRASRHRIAGLSAYFMEALESFRSGGGSGSGHRGRGPTNGSEPKPALSAREVDCLHWVSAGKSNPEIGMILEVSTNTVHFHLKNAFRKLDVTSRVTAVGKAQTLGLI